MVIKVDGEIRQFFLLPELSYCNMKLYQNKEKIFFKKALTSTKVFVIMGYSPKGQ